MTLDAEDLLLDLPDNITDIFKELTGNPVGELVFFNTTNTTYDDNCTLVVVRTFYVQDTGFTNLTYFNESDLDNNYTHSCAQQVTVVDETPPEISCPKNEEVNCLTPYSEADTGLVNVTDNCESDVTDVTVSCCAESDQEGNIFIT